MLEASDDRVSCRNAGLLEALIDALRMASRALAAAHYYETLRVASDQMLARRGLTRGDVPRAVYRMLTRPY
jgi:hypothetical protein